MKKILVILLVAVSLFALVSCSDKETAEIFASTDGKIHVNFDKKQDVSTKSVTLGKSTTVVKYDVCTSANVTIEPIEFVESINDHINLFTLVAVDDTKKNFVLALTLDGAVLDTIGAIVGDIIGVLPEKITISGNVGNMSDWLGGNVGTLPIDFGVDIDSFSLDTSFGLDGLTIAPIYITEDILGALSDFLAGDLIKSVSPLTVVNVTYTNGKTACATTLDKVSANISFAKASGESNGKIVGAEDGVTYYIIAFDGSQYGFHTYIRSASNPTFPCKFNASGTTYNDILVIAKKANCVSGFCFYKGTM